VQRQRRERLTGIEALEQSRAGHLLVHLHDAAATELRGDLAAAPLVALLFDYLQHEGTPGAVAVHDDGGGRLHRALDRKAPRARAEHDPVAELLAHGAACLLDATFDSPGVGTWNSVRCIASQERADV